MKKLVIVLGILVLGFYLAGCGKKTEPLASQQEPMPIDTVSTMNTEPLVKTEDKLTAPQTQNFVPANEAKNTASVTKAKLEPLPPQGPFKPSVKEIQSALKNAGFYTGAVDGKIGPASKKAIEEFQKAKGLKADGKVGPKTWAVLGPYLKQGKSNIVREQGR